ncbi:NAD(+) diphosphatase [Buchananella hordeovulneris]|uniref:NAD(+) diphosphatase n=1 Tax=Buchananella hordeovulneris TaxID=52770 RepID=UPI000F5FE614|nr:NAD(+) diphosphatase [Buchananella hordeovulneris]RRD43152.1 NAD(+) diphosphatase [Buchananella hordeovulneris]
MNSLPQLARGALVRPPAHEWETDRAAAAADPAARVLWVGDDGTLAADDTGRVLWDEPGEQATYLGRGPGGPLFAQLAASAALPPGATDWVGVRRIAHALTADASAAAVTAVALAAFHATHRFCGRCGGDCRADATGWQRTCNRCGQEIYPRIDPAIIVAITDAADRLLLAHNSRFAPARRSVVAGFVEAGESLETAVQREVREEVGLEVEAIVYAASQAWPFPRALMLAFTAQAATTRVQVDGQEIDAADFYSRAQVRAETAAGRLELPPAHSVGRWLVERWLAAPAGH